MNVKIKSRHKKTITNNKKQDTNKSSLKTTKHKKSQKH